MDSLLPEPDKKSPEQTGNTFGLPLYNLSGTPGIAPEA